MMVFGHLPRIYWFVFRHLNRLSIAMIDYVYLNKFHREVMTQAASSESTYTYYTDCEWSLESWQFFRWKKAIIIIAYFSVTAGLIVHDISITK